MSAASSMSTYGKSFALAAKLLPARLHEDVAVVYQFCRLVDDIADERGDLRGLDAIRDELGGDNPRPEVAAYLEVVVRHHVPLGAAHDLLDGCASDIGVVRVQDESELLRYAYRVAGTVGLMMAAVFGARGGRVQAIDLGLAMQLTNIARDIAEDAGRDRVYLPATWLAEAELSGEDVVAGRAPAERLAPLVERLLTLADRYYESADEGMHHLPLLPRLAVLAASRVYRAIGVHLRARGSNPLLGRVVVPNAHRFFWLLVGVAQLVRPRLWGWSNPHDPGLHTALRGLPGVGSAS